MRHVAWVGGIERAWLRCVFQYQVCVLRAVGGTYLSASRRLLSAGQWFRSLRTPGSLCCADACVVLFLQA